MDLIETVYSVATDEQPWQTFADKLCAELPAGSMSLWRGNSDGVAEMIYAPPAPAGWAEAYAEHYCRLDLWTIAGFARLGTMTVDQRPVAYVSDELVPSSTLRRSEFHNDFARHLDMYHLVGSVAPLGDAGWMAIGIHRPEHADDFSDREKRVVEAILPHLRRALQLRHALRGSLEGVAAAALDSMPTGAIVVDADMQIVHMNVAAEGMAAAGGLRLRRDLAVTRLGTEHREDSATLASRVREVALAGADGGGVRVRRADGRPPLACRVMPLPRSMTRRHPTSLHQGFALVLVRDPVRVSLPADALLADLFGLTRAEAAVALAAARGCTAEAIALQRGASIATVRTQLRNVLEKCGAATLRDLTRILTTLAG